MRTDQHFYKYSGISPYHFGYNSPISFVDNDGKDILMYDNKGNLVTWIQIKDHDDIAFQLTNYTIGDNWDGPTVINLNNVIDKLGVVNPFLANINKLQPDAVGIGIGIKADFPLIEMGYSMEAINFLEGPNQFETHYYGSTSGEFGTNSSGIDGAAPGEFLGGQVYFVLGYNNKDKKDFTANSWTGNEESFNMAFPEIGGIGFEWSNESDSPTLFPDFRDDVNGKENLNRVSQFEITFSPSIFNQAAGVSYSSGTVFNLDGLENLVSTPDRIVNTLFQVERLSKEQHEQLKKNNAKRSWEVSIKKSMPRFK